MNAERGPFARNTTLNSAPYTIGTQRKRPDHRMTSYNRALEITRCQSIETTLRTRLLLRAGALIRMSGGRLPKRIVSVNLEGAVRRGRGGKEKEWTDRVQSDIRAFGIAGDWKATALEAEVWVETVTEGGRRLMAAWSFLILFLLCPNEQRGGVRCQTFSFVLFSLFSRPRAGLATLYSSFFGLSTNTLNAKKV